MALKNSPTAKSPRIHKFRVRHCPLAILWVATHALFLASSVAGRERISFTLQISNTVDVWAIDSDGTNLENLTNQPSIDKHAAWSPDGRRLAFASDVAGSQCIWTMKADGTDWRMLTSAAGSDLWPSWSPDGSQIVFVSTRTWSPEIWIMGSDGSNQRQITTSPETEFYPSWSPDGARIGFNSDYDDDGLQDIWTLNTDGTDPRSLSVGSGDTEMTWSPSGAEIAFMSIRTGDSEIWVMNADGSDPRNLSSSPGVDSDPSWSPDGTRIAFLSFRQEGRGLWIMEANGSNPVFIGPSGPDISFGRIAEDIEIPTLRPYGLLLLATAIAAAGIGTLIRKH